MPWAAIASAAVGLYGQRKAGKRADKQFALQDEMMREEMALRREGLDFSKNQYQDWKNRYDPVYSKVMSHIEEGIDPDYNAIAGDVKAGFGSARDQNRRQMLRYGIRPQDGAFAHADRESRLSESAAHVGTRNQARQASKGIRYARYADLHNSLQGIGTNLAGNVGQAYAGVANAAAGQGGVYAGRGINAWNSGVAEAQGWGNFIGNVDWGAAWDKAKGWFGGNSTGNGSAATGGGYGPPG